jgi:hypothetical protein
MKRGVLERLRPHAGSITSIGISLGVFNLLSGGSVQWALFAGCSAAAMWSITCLVQDRRARRRLSEIGLSRPEMGLDVSVTAIVEAGESDLISACRDAICALPNYRSVVESETPARLSGKTRINFDSLGEQLDLSVERIDDKAAKLTVRSRPRWPLATEDMGFNYQNVALILRSLARKYSVRSISPDSFRY